MRPVLVCKLHGRLHIETAVWPLVSITVSPFSYREISPYLTSHNRSCLELPQSPAFHSGNRALIY